MLASMLPVVVIRRARPDESNSIHVMVQTIADETFAGLFTTPHVPIGEANWLTAWVAIANDEIVGVTMTHDSWVNDLWVRRDSRRLGLGAKLLAHAEAEIRSRGHDTFRLRVVKSNTRAVQFYQSQGWDVHREFAHEKFGHAMCEMTKNSSQGSHQQTVCK
ncbi:MAG TPA: GNAT family N-acetyltransferase [Candidatus Methylomirabilis sp.]|nr:GNAT family N-acetyltransferase [Candidatus Methylomirabilis sp.]